MSTQWQNELADLKQRIRRLEESAQQVASRPVRNRDGGRMRLVVDQVAHGLAFGRLVQAQADGTWALAIAKPQKNEADSTIGNLRNTTLGVISSVINPDSFEVTLSGYLDFVPGREIAEDPFDPLPGCVYSLSETEAGRMTARTTSTGIRVFSTVSEEDGVLMSFRDRDQVIAEWVASTAPVGKVIDVVTGALASAAAPPSPFAHRFGLVIASTGTQALACVSGLCTVPPSAVPNAGLCYLSATVPGDLTNTKPTTPVAQRPILIGHNYDNGTFWVHPPTDEVPGIGELWDVDHSTPPANYQLLIWDDTAKRYKPDLVGSNNITPGSIAGAQLANFNGFSILANPAATPASASQVAAAADGHVLWRDGTTLGFGKIKTVAIDDKAVTPTKMADAAAHTVVGNGTNAAASPSGITASTDGSVLNRQGSSTAFVTSLELGASGVGGGTLTIHWSASGYYFQVANDGTIRISWGSSNSLEINPSDIVGSSRQFRIREVDGCDSSGVAKKMQVIGTDWY